MSAFNPKHLFRTNSLIKDKEFLDINTKKSIDVNKFLKKKEQYKKQIEEYLKKTEKFDIIEFFKDINKLDIDKNKFNQIIKQVNSKTKNINLEQINKILNFLNIKHSDLKDKYNLKIKDIRFEKKNYIEVFFENKKETKNIKNTTDISVLYNEQYYIEQKYKSSSVLESIYMYSYKNLTNNIYTKKEIKLKKQLNYKNNLSLKEKLSLTKKHLEEIDILKIIQKEALEQIKKIINNSYNIKDLNLENTEKLLKINEQLKETIEEIDIIFKEINKIEQSIKELDQEHINLAINKIKEKITKINSNINLKLGSINLTLQSFPKYYSLIDKLLSNINEEKIEEITNKIETKFDQEKNEKYDLDLSYL